MINNVYQLVGTRTLVVRFEDISLGDRVIVRPDFLALCHADQRYYLGQRSHAVLQKKLPMAPLHEASGTVVFDPTGTYSAGQRVALIPNISGDTTQGLYENYATGAAFRSSGHDGFLRELVALPLDRTVAVGPVPPVLAAITEFVSVAVHAVSRFDSLAHPLRQRIALIGDGSMAYVLANVVKARFPHAQVVILGRHEHKLALFSFADETYYSDALPANLAFDHAFECTGSQGSAAAIETLIQHVNPQGSIVLLGVSEQPVPITTRMVLEKGLTLVGCSRSGREDFVQALELMADSHIQQRLRQIIHVDEPVRSVADIKRVFATDLLTPFKTVFEWRI